MIDNFGYFLLFSIWFIVTLPLFFVGATARLLFIILKIGWEIGLEIANTVVKPEGKKES